MKGPVVGFWRPSTQISRCKSHGRYRIWDLIAEYLGYLDPPGCLVFSQGSGFDYCCGRKPQ